MCKVNISSWLNTFAYYFQETDISVHLKKYKQAGAKIRAHISGPWSRLQPVCLQHYTFFKNITKHWHYSQLRSWYFSVAILYPSIQWVMDPVIGVCIICSKSVYFSHWSINPFQSGNWSISMFGVSLYSGKQAGAKIRTHLCGPWSWLQSVCLQHYTFWKYIARNKFFKFVQTFFHGS